MTSDISLRRPFIIAQGERLWGGRSTKLWEIVDQQLSFIDLRTDLGEKTENALLSHWAWIILHKQRDWPVRCAFPRWLFVRTKTPYHAACLSKDDFNRASCILPVILWEFHSHRQKIFHEIVHIMETGRMFRGLSIHRDHENIFSRSPQAFFREFLSISWFIKS